MAVPFINKKDVVETELVWLCSKIEVGDLFNPANIKQQLSTIFIR